MLKRLTVLTALLVLGASPGLEAAAPAGEWWNAGYLYRQKLNLTAGATAIPTQYSARVQIDHAAMVFAGQSLATGNDVRVAYWNGSAWVELDRLLDDQSSWNNAATEFWFRTQAGIGASSTDDNYYVYYGNPSAGTPPANWTNVFLLYDDFNDGVFDASRWICADPTNWTPPPACTESAVAPGTLSLGDDSAVYATAGYAFGTNTRWEGRLRLATALATTLAYNYLGASDMVSPTQPYQNDWTTFWASPSSHILENANNGTGTNSGAVPIATPTSYHVYTFDREGLTSVRFRQDGAEVGNIVSNVPDGNLRVLVWNDDAMNAGIVLDWVRVRRYVTPEPTFTQSALELGPGQMRVLSGTYSGNGVDNRSIFVGFQPDVVFIDRDDPSNPGTDDEAVLRTSTMPAGSSKFVDAGGGIPLAVNGVKSFTSQGFTIGTHNNVNQNGITYYWVAFQAAPGQLEVGTYTGSSSAQDITSVGFSPAYVISISEGSQNAMQKTSLMPGNFSQTFSAAGYTDAILNLLLDGFRVGTNVVANNNGTVYHYLAWGAVPGKVAVGTYTGGVPADNRDITGTGFFPEWVIVNRSSNAAGNQGNASVHKPASSGVSTDRAPLFDTTITETDNIQRLQVNGFQVGSHSRVNDSAAPNTYYWIAFGPHTPQINYRSIGPAANESTGTLTATNGSPDLSGAGTLWRTRNRGRGDVITICDDFPVCATNVDYAVLSVASDTSLTLTTPYGGTSGGGKTFTLKRQFTRPIDWGACIDGPPGCPYFPTVSSSLVADDRSEVGIVYNDDGPDGDALPEPFLPPAIGTPIAWVTGITTDATHTVKLTVDPGNRHAGVGWSGSGATPHVAFDNRGNTEPAVRIGADFVTAEWLDIRDNGPGSRAGFAVDDFSGLITPSNGSVSSTIVLRNNLLHDLDMAFDVGTTSVVLDIYNNFVYTCNRATRIDSNQNTDPSLIRVLNNTAWGCVDGFHVGPGANGRVLLRNNIAAGSAGNDFWLLGALNALSSDNLSEDANATGASPGGGAEPNRPLNGAGGINFVDDTLPTINLHLQGTSWALDRAVDLSVVFNFDIDGGSRVLPWDIGADDTLATTEVKLSSFDARGVDSAVELTWETASELSNLGFNLYRSTLREGPYVRVTDQVIPGLGSSPVGAKYFFRDSGLENGITYFYELEDIETTGTATRHGPVTATPSASVAPDVAGSSSRITYGRPENNSFRVRERTAAGVVIELLTEGFHAEPQEDGSVLLEIPGFDSMEGSPSVPVVRPWVDSLVGRGARIASVRESEVSAFPGLRPSGAGANEIVASRSGAVFVRRGGAQASAAMAALAPPHSARLLRVGFQGESKKVQVELSPLRWNGANEELLLARRLTVSIDFRGRAADERRSVARGRSVAARLVTSSAGLHEVPYEGLFRGRGVSTDALRLSRLGRPVAFHVEPDKARFGPGSRLYFVSEGPGANPYGRELIYELELTDGGLRMERSSAEPSGEIVASYLKTDAYEENRFYQAGLVDAEDLWLWDVLLAPVTKSFPFEVKDLAPGPSVITVRLQGVSDFDSDPDHHVRLYVNDVLEGELSWDGKGARNAELALAPGSLREGANVLAIENAGDTEAPYSMVMLDRFDVVSPRRVSGEGGRLEGVFSETGTAFVPGLGASLLVDVTGPTPIWLRGGEVLPDGAFRFRAESGRRYLSVSRSAAARPLVRSVPAARLRKETLAADYLVVGPRAFGAEAAVLLDRRRTQGLIAKFAAVEDVYGEFGFGEPRPEAIREFLKYVYHHWRGPRLRYVLLLGDGTYDFKDYLKTGVENQIPPLLVKTSYLWTASDPTYAAVNGDDVLPDVAIGRLPASSVAELRNMISKILAYESGEAGLGGLLVLAADNPDAAGDFPSNAEEIADGVLAGKPVRRLYLHELGGLMTGEIVRAFDEGASLVSYVGHGGIHLWASENVLDIGDAGSLAPQPQQPLLLTMNCLNGYFHFPYFDSLAEALLKADGRGAIAAFSPSGLSLNDPAHRFHELLLNALFHQGHERLGDAVLKAQEDYARSGAFPELLSIYHLLGDPALALK